MDIVQMKFMAPEPYPAIGTLEKNPCYAKEILSNIGGSNSEMNAISLYLYNHFMESIWSEEYSAIFKRIAEVEMHHLNIFGLLTVRLGENPRMWADQCNQMVYWTPKYNQYPTELLSMMQNSLDGEILAIEKYQRQARQIENETVVACLLRIIEDEEVHVRIFTDIIQKFKRTC